MDISREKDIQRLCRQVVNLSPPSHYNPNGADWTNCPLCYNEVKHADGTIEEIKHEPYCAYLIAKDLTTRIDEP